jgi:cathepsin X
MMQEIYQRGPVACAVSLPKGITEYEGGIFNDTTGNIGVEHDISVVGWGVENGVKFWIMRNSWGS